MTADLDAMLGSLRTADGDTAAIEVKSAAGGLPESITSSLSALANLPGGGVIILGLDEGAGFAPVGLTDPQVLKRGLGAKARAFQPPIQLTISDDEADGDPVVVAVVQECDPSAKPCRVASTGRAYLRSYDGDYEMSQLEEQGFLSARSAPLFDRLGVPGTSEADLDDDLLRVWRDTVRQRKSGGLGRFTDAGILQRAGIVTTDGTLSRAGLLSLGEYPQQYFPRFVVHVADMSSAADIDRARNARVIDGPLPTMLSQTLAWLRENLSTNVVGQMDGSVRDQYEFPLEALRELVANALVHRDLDSWSEGMAVELRLYRDKLVVTNPGGLYGITVDRLGREHVTSARNARLVSICEDARDARDGARVIEALASGLPRVAAQLDAARLPPAQFFDSGIRFTVLLRSTWETASRPRAAGAPLPPEGTNLRRIYNTLLGGREMSITEIADRTGITEASVRRALTRLREAPYTLVSVHGGRGRATKYTASVGPQDPARGSHP